MRFRLLGSLVVLAGLVVPLQAQQNVETASQRMVLDALQALEIRATQDGDAFSFDLKDRAVTLQRLGKGKALLIKASSAKQPSLETINRYNEQIAVTTRAVRYERIGVILEAGLDCQLGITGAGLQKFISRFGNDLEDFENFVAKQQETPGGGEIKEGKRKVPLAIVPNSDDKQFVITFPTSDPRNWETAWKIVWDIETGKQANEQQFKFPKGRDGAPILFKIKKAYFKPGQKAEWIQVLEDAHPSEFYVPYYFRDTRFYDLKFVGSYVPLSPKEGAAISQPLSKSKRVMAELRDRGPAYKHGNITRRGEELTLWANFVASNYTYLVEYGFNDDGTIVFRHAPTGYNFFNHLDASHMHGSYWRIGVKLGPEGNNETNQVHVSRLPTNPQEQGSKGKLNLQEITKESFVDWNPREFTRIRITNPNYSVVPEAKDRPALPISYDLVTQVQGIARHERFKDEKFSHHDFWITRHDCPEKMYVNLGEYFYPKGVLNQELRPLDRENVVLWHSSSALHVPRSEDGIIGGNSVNNGQALVYFTSFELRPRNLFLKTPIYRSLP